MPLYYAEEDKKVVSITKKAGEMLADIGTKALSDRQSAYLGNLINGYSLAKASHSP